jgi:hypothetical protein
VTGASGGIATRHARKLQFCRGSTKTDRTRMSTEPDSLILQMLREMRADMATKADVAAVKGDIATMRSEFSDLKADFNSLRADVASDMMALRKDVGDRIGGLRRAVVEYHTSVIGHGVLISELEARLRRVEQHLDLPEAH